MEQFQVDFHRLFEAAPGLYLVLTPGLRIVAVSDAYLNATMTTRAAIHGRYLFDVFPDNPDDPAATGVNNLRASLERVLLTGQPDSMAVQKYDVRRPDGDFEERFWSPLNSPVLNAAGAVEYIIHRVEDVTEFVRLKQAGSEQERQARELQTLAQRMEAEVYLRAQEIAAANRRLAQAYQQIHLLLAPGAAPGTAEPAGTDLLPPEEMLARIESLIVRHSHLEEQLRQSQKMEAVGLLAGGVAHDFNNLLTVITGYASILRETRVGSDGLPELEEIEKAALRASSLTQKLLAFSRKQILQPRVIDLNDVVTGMEELLRRLLGEDVILVTNLGSALGPVKADPHQLEQVIMNLSVNARDAMPEGGRLIIDTTSFHLSHEFPSLRPGPYIVLSVADTGHGMDAQTAARIFEPFFTTKDTGKGTGLGLATVYGIVEQSGGIVTVESAPGAGAKFRVYLPVVDSTAEREQPTSPQVAVACVGRRTILLVEDEAPLRKIVYEILNSGGYDVLIAANGEAALALAQRLPSPPDLLLTDVVMPGMNGPDLVLRLHALFPDVPVLYMSGYDRDLVDRRSLDHGVRFLPKPFTPRALLARLGEMFANGSRADLGSGEPADA